MQKIRGWGSRTRLFRNAYRVTTPSSTKRKEFITYSTLLVKRKIGRTNLALLFSLTGQPDTNHAATEKMDVFHDPLSNIINDIKLTEIEYRDNLLRLLACCNPSKRNDPFCKIIRKLIATHNELDIGNAPKAETDLANWFSWLLVAIPVYHRYIELLTFKGCIDLEISYRKFPLMRLNQINRSLRALHDEIEFNRDILVVVNKFQELLVDAKDKVETENLSLDLNTFKFDNVMSISNNFPDPAYFNKNDVVRRDYFKLTVLGHELFTNEILVELFKLKSDRIAICSMEKYGRNMVFPSLKINEFIIYHNDISLIHLKSKDSEIEFKFTCPDKEQMKKWIPIINDLNKLDNSSFLKRFNHLNTLKNGNVGTGIYTNEIIPSLAPSRIIKPQSPNRDSIILKSKISDLSLNSKLNDHKDTPPQLASYNNESTDSLHLPSLSSESLDPESFTSSLKASQFYTTKTPSHLKNCISDNGLRKSANLVADHDSVKSIDSQKRPSLRASHQQESSSEQPSIPFYTKVMNSTASLPAPQRPLQSKDSTSSLRNTGTVLQSKNSKINMDDSKPKKKVKKRKSIFGLFGKKSTSPKFELVTPQKIPSPIPSVNHDVLSNCLKVKSITNSVMISKWNDGNEWETLGSEQNLLEFYVNDEHHIMRFQSGMELTIPINNPKTTITKSNARDLQIRCLQSINSSKLIILSIRCKDKMTLSSILEEFSEIDSLAQSQSSGFITPARSGYTTPSRANSEASSIKLSKSTSSDLFDELPSNSTSMSSVNLNDMFQPPKLYSQKSSSTLNLKSETSTITSSISVHELLLKSDIKIKLHKLDAEQDWIPVSLGQFSISSNIHNPEYSRFDIVLPKAKINTMVQNSTCSRLGKSGLRFITIGDDGEDTNYLLEFRNQKECEEIYECLQ